MNDKEALAAMQHLSKASTRGSYAERRITQATGIEQIEFCRTIALRMFDDCGGLGHLTGDEFDAAAIKAARDMFPAAMGIKS